MRRQTLARAALLLLLPLAACSDETGPDGADAGTAASPDAAGDEPRPTYVALGDSYTAAPLVVDETAVDGCMRSSANYPNRVADELGYDLVDVSCGGATTEHLRTSQATSTGEVPPQLDALVPDAALVTIGLGGNDLNVFSRLIQCTAVGAGDPACGEDLETDIDAIGGHLEQAVAAVREQAPDAEVVVVGYPQIIAADSSCPDLIPVPPADLPHFAALNERLHTVQQAAAEAAEVAYADLYDASIGHDVCADDPWVHGQETVPGVALGLHPTAAGQQAAADLVVEALS